MAGNWTSYAVANTHNFSKVFCGFKVRQFSIFEEKLAISPVPGIIGYSIHKLKRLETGQHTVQEIQVNIWICK